MCIFCVSIASFASPLHHRGVAILESSPRPFEDLIDALPSSVVGSFYGFDWSEEKAGPLFWFAVWPPSRAWTLRASAGSFPEKHSLMSR